MVQKVEEKDSYLLGKARGRLYEDPSTRQTRNGNRMVTCKLEVQAPYHAKRSHPQIINVAAFAELADVLSAQRKGDEIVVMGEMVTELYDANRDRGQPPRWRISLSITADRIVAARSEDRPPANVVNLRR